MSVTLQGTPTTTQAGASGSIGLAVPGGSSNDGRLLIAVIASRGNATITAPAGWTAITDGVTTLDDHDSTIITMKAFQRTDDGTLGATQTFTSNQTTGNCGFMLRLDGAHATAPLHKTAKANSAGTATGAPISPSVTTTTTAFVLLMEALSNGTQINASGEPTGYDEIVDFKDTSGTASLQLGCFTKQQGGAGATGAQTITSAGAPAGRWVAFTLAIKANSGGGGTAGSAPPITTVPNKDGGVDGISYDPNWKSHIMDNLNAGVVTGIACRVFKGTVTGTTGSLAALPFDNERFDTDAMHDTAVNNTRITINKGGVYLIAGNVEWAIDTGRVNLQIRLNGTDTIAAHSMVGTGGVATRQEIVTLWDCAAGDYFELMVSSANSIQVSATTKISPEFSAMRM